MSFTAVPYKYAGKDKTKTYSNITIGELSYFTDTTASSEIVKTPAPTSTIPQSYITFIFYKTYTLPLQFIN